MEVRFVSSLTSEDEERYAPAVLAALAGMLDHTNLAYTIHIRTSGDRVFQHHHPASFLDGTDEGLRPVQFENGNRRD
jgi:hypothetical protein